MLRIRVEDQLKTTTLYVEGRLTGDGVDELERVWVSLRNEALGKETVLDLCSVRAVDSKGRKLLSQMHAGGTRLAGNGLIIGPLIQEIISSASFVD